MTTGAANIGNYIGVLPGCVEAPQGERVHAILEHGNRTQASSSCAATPRDRETHPLVYELNGAANLVMEYSGLTKPIREDPKLTDHVASGCERAALASLMQLGDASHCRVHGVAVKGTEMHSRHPTQ